MPPRQTGPDLLRRRLLNQHVAGAQLRNVEDVVSLLGAVQSQDYAGAKWSLGQRVNDATDAGIDQAFSSGTIVRTHVMRPTWHFVMPADIRWMLQLTAPRVHALNAYYYKKMELDAAALTRSHKVFTSELQGGRQLTRHVLAAALAKAGLVAKGLRLAYVIMHAELEGLLCSGALEGSEHTYALLDERVPNVKPLSRDAALAKLTRRFFTGHAPATLRHFVWWSGLTLKDAKVGLAMNERHLSSESIDGKQFWSATSALTAPPARSGVYLIPEYDEVLVGSKDFGPLDMPRAPRSGEWADVWYRPVIVDGRRAGTWRRTISRGRFILETNLFARLNSAQTKRLEDAAARYGRFLGLPVQPSGERQRQTLRRSR